MYWMDWLFLFCFYSRTEFAYHHGSPLKSRGWNQNVLVFLPVGNVLAWWAFQRTMSLPISTVSWRIWMVWRWFEASLSLWKSVETAVICRFFFWKLGFGMVFLGGGIELRRLEIRKTSNRNQTRPPPLKMYVWGEGTPCFFIHFYLVPKMVLGKM